MEVDLDAIRKRVEGTREFDYSEYPYRPESRGLGHQAAIDKDAELDREELLREVDRLSIESALRLKDLEESRFDAENLRAKNEQLEQDLNRITDPTIRRMSITDGELNMELNGPELARYFAVHFWNLLDENQAENYAEFSFAAPEKPLKRVVVTVRKVHGKTPDDLRMEAQRALIEHREQANQWMSETRAALLGDLGVDEASQALPALARKIRQRLDSALSALTAHRLVVGAIKELRACSCKKPEFCRHRARLLKMKLPAEGNEP